MAQLTTEPTDEPFEVNQFDHINIMEIDPNFKPIDEGFYTLQLTRLVTKTVKPSKGKNAGKDVLILTGYYTVVGDENFSGRRLRNTFWTSNPVDLKALRRQADATGVTQSEGQTLTEYASTFETLDPPAEFGVFVAVEKPWNAQDENDRENVIKFNQARPVGA